MDSYDAYPESHESTFDAGDGNAGSAGADSMYEGILDNGSPDGDLEDDVLDRSGGGSEAILGTSDRGIREVTPDSIVEDLEAGRLNLHPDIAEGLGDAIEEGNISFYVSESATGEPRGQVGVNWRGSRSEAIQEVAGNAPQLSFLSVPEGARGQGTGSDLLQTVYDQAIARGHTGLFLSVEVGNVGAQRLYLRDGWEHTGLTIDSLARERDESGEYGEPVPVRSHVMYKHLAQQSPDDQD